MESSDMSAITCQEDWESRKVAAGEPLVRDSNAVATKKNAAEPQVSEFDIPVNAFEDEHPSSAINNAMSPLGLISIREVYPSVNMVKDLRREPDHDNTFSLTSDTSDLLTAVSVSNEQQEESTQCEGLQAEADLLSGQSEPTGTRLYTAEDLVQSGVSGLAVQQEISQSKAANSCTNEDYVNLRAQQREQTGASCSIAPCIGSEHGTMANLMTDSNDDAHGSSEYAKNENETSDHETKLLQGSPCDLVITPGNFFGVSDDLDKESPVEAIGIPAAEPAAERSCILTTGSHRSYEKTVCSVFYGSSHDLERMALRMTNYGDNSGVILKEMEGRLNIVDGQYQKKFQWRTKELLGHGGQGECHLAEDLKASDKKDDSFQFSVKTISDRYRPEEIIIMVKLIEHPNIVKIYGALKCDEKVHILMEFLQGCSLSKWISDRRGRIDKRDALMMFQQLLDVLAYLESQRILHEDIKAENIMVVPADNYVRPLPGGIMLKLIDFGLATETIPVPKDINPLGTVTHFSPEKAQSLGYKYKSDVYAATMTFVHMLTGKVPRADFNWGRVLLLAGMKGPPVECIPSSLPGYIKEIIEKGWTKDPANRLLAHQLIKLVCQVVTNNVCAAETSDVTDHLDDLRIVSSDDEASSSNEEEQHVGLRSEVYSSPYMMLDLGIEQVVRNTKAVPDDIGLEAGGEREEPYRTLLELGSDWDGVSCIENTK